MGACAGTWAQGRHLGLLVSGIGVRILFWDVVYGRRAVWPTARRIKLLLQQTYFDVSVRNSTRAILARPVYASQMVGWLVESSMLMCRVSEPTDGSG